MIIGTRTDIPSTMMPDTAHRIIGNDGRAWKCSMCSATRPSIPSLMVHLFTQHEIDLRFISWRRETISYEPPAVQESFPK